MKLPSKQIIIIVSIVFFLVSITSGFFVYQWYNASQITPFGVNKNSEFYVESYEKLNNRINYTVKKPAITLGGAKLEGIVFNQESHTAYYSTNTKEKNFYNIVQLKLKPEEREEFIRDLENWELNSDENNGTNKLKKVSINDRQGYIRYSSNRLFDAKNDTVTEEQYRLNLIWLDESSAYYINASPDLTDEQLVELAQSYK